MILVTGATGYIGRKAVTQLWAGGFAVAALARSVKKAKQVVPSGIPIRIGDYEDKSSLARAFRDVSSLLFIASDGHRDIVMRHHANIIDVAASMGVRRIVFTSITDVAEDSPFYFAPVYRDAERRLVDSGVEWTILRCGLYADFILANWLRPARLTGKLRLPLDDATVAPISRDDVASAATAAVQSSCYPGKTFAITGPVSYTINEIATAASRVFGIPMRYIPCHPDEYLRRAQSEMADPWPLAFSSLFAAVREGRFGATANDVEPLIGRPAELFGHFVERAAIVESVGRL